MSSKMATKVVINGKVYTLAGYESEDYLQKVASYVDNKISEHDKIEGFKRLNLDVQNILIHLNIADDYMKAKKQIELLEEELQGKEKEVYDLKHELISTQMKLDVLEKKADSQKQEDPVSEQEKNPADVKQPGNGSGSGGQNGGNGNSFNNRSNNRSGNHRR